MVGSQYLVPKQYNMSMFDADNEKVKDYLSKLNDLIRGELLVTKEDGMKLMVEGSLNLERFLECYVNTRKEIRFELLTKIMTDLPNGSYSKSDIIKLIRDLIDAEPKRNDEVN